MKKQSYLRLWELDVLRASALVLMLVQHLAIVWNYVFFGIADTGTLQERIGRIGALTFITLVGISGFLSYNRLQASLTDMEIRYHFFVRGLIIIFWGMVITAVSFFVFPKSPIVYGVLHFIGTSVLLLPYLISNRWFRWFVILTAPLLSITFSQYRLEFPWLFMFGLYRVDFTALDHWPLFPWLGLVCVGIEVGMFLYKDGVRRFPFFTIKNEPIKFLTWIGSHTLFLYMIHIPFLYLLFSAVRYIVEL